MNGPVGLGKNGDEERRDEIDFVGERGPTVFFCEGMIAATCGDVLGEVRGDACTIFFDAGTTFVVGVVGVVGIVFLNTGEGLRTVSPFFEGVTLCDGGGDK